MGSGELPGGVTKCCEGGVGDNLRRLHLLSGVGGEGMFVHVDSSCHNSCDKPGPDHGNTQRK